jgi:hypothetical protein
MAVQPISQIHHCPNLLIYWLPLFSFRRSQRQALPYGTIRSERFREKGVFGCGLGYSGFSSCWRPGWVINEGGAPGNFREMCGRFGHGEMSSVSIWVQGQSYIAEEEAVYCLCRGIPDKGVLKPSQRQGGLGFDFDLDFVSTSAYVYM